MDIYKTRQPGLVLLCLCAITSPSLAALDNQPAEQFEKECRQSLEASSRQFETIISLQGTKTASRVLEPLNDLEVLIDRGYSKAQLYYNVHPLAEVRSVAEKCAQDFSELITNITLSRPLFDVISAVDVSAADKDTQRYWQQTLRDFKRSGVNKDEATRERIRGLQEELVKLGQQFSSNIRNDVRSITLDSAKQLAGLPDDYVDNHPANEQGKILISTDYPDYFPFMKYAKDDALRKSLYVEFRNRGYPDNEKISTIADKRSDADYQTLLKRLQKINPKAKEVGDWQKTYLSELVRNEQYDFDSKAVRQYFAYDKVRDGIFTLLGKLFDVSIKPWQTSAWHESVEAYEVWDKGELIAYFYLDMHPREGKYKHAAHFSLQNGLEGRQLPISSLVCNFPGGDGSPGLMSHDQVETFLHEFGHLIHHFFGGKQRWSSFSGVATEWDFVEAPSQMLEEWIWDADTLKLFATNERGETIPDELIEKMNSTRYFGFGLNVKNQMFYAATSLNYYNRNPDSFELTPMMVKMQQRYSPYDYVDGTHFFASFGHLDGYSAIYYTYMWSLVIANDLFSRFRQEGMNNRSVAQQYRQQILAPGGSADAAELVENFLGRPYDFRAFETELNKGTH